MKIEKTMSYKYGYAQGYYDAIRQIQSDTERKKEWAYNSLMAVINEMLEEQKIEEANEGMF